MNKYALALVEWNKIKTLSDAILFIHRHRFIGEALELASQIEENNKLIDKP